MIRLGRPLGLLSIVVALVGTGCTGGTTGPGVARVGSTPSASSSGQAGPLAFSACMRSNSVPNFPDPIVGHGFQFNLPTGMDPNSPQFQAAQTACVSWLPQHGKGMRRAPPESP